MSAPETTPAQQVVGIALGFVCVFIPASLEWMVPGAAPASTLLLVATLGGAVAGRVLVPRGERLRAHLVAMASGAISAAGAFALLRWWVGGRASVATAEFLLVTLIGALPGALLGLHVFGRLRRREPPLPPALARPRPSRAR